MTDLVRTALHDRHVAAGATMSPFAGWEMPLAYQGTLAEHRAVREEVGVFDVSHLGTVFVSGPGAAGVIARSFTGDAAAVECGRSQYMLCCTESGGIIDDLIVYHLEPGRTGDGSPMDVWMVVPNAANTAAVVARLEDQAMPGDAAVTDESTAHVILAVQGPRALATASAVVGFDVAQVPYLGVRRLEGPTGAVGTVCRTGYTGEPGCEIVAPNAGAGALWDALHAGGSTPCGLGARDTLRLEMGYPLHGNDIDRSTSPYEARLGWAVKLDHGDFVGRDALAGARGAGPSRRLWGLRSSGRRPLRAGLAVLAGGDRVGTTTSGGFSPTLEVGIALGYLDVPLGAGDTVEVDVRGTSVSCAVVRPPFIDRDPRT